MSKTCDLCGGVTGVFRKFRCQDGVICKECYRLVSGNYTDTVAGKTLEDLKRIYVQTVQKATQNKN